MTQAQLEKRIANLRKALRAIAKGHPSMWRIRTMAQDALEADVRAVRRASKDGPTDAG